MESNPFGSGNQQINDPFDDPSVRNAYVDDYVSPFHPSSAPLRLPPKEEAKESLLPQGGNSDSAGGGSVFEDKRTRTGLTADDLRIREENLIRRERELAERERNLQSKEGEMHEKLGHEKNWPSKCWALAYHSIPDEIPARLQPLIWRCYGCVLYTWLCLFYNWLVMIAVLVTDQNSTNNSSDALWASLFMVFGVVGAWKLWYRQIYQAAMKGASSKWLVFFGVYFLHILFSILMALGVNYVAGGGLFLLLKLGGVPLAMCIVSMSLWIVNVFASIYLFRQAHLKWKGEGGDSELKKELAKQVVDAQLTSGRV